MLHGDQKVVELHPNSCSYRNFSFNFIFVVMTVSLSAGMVEHVDQNVLGA